MSFWNGKSNKGMDEGLIPLKDQELSVIARFFGDAQSSHFDAVAELKINT